MEITQDELLAVLPQAGEKCKMELTILVLQRRITALEEELQTQRQANSLLESAVKGSP